MNIQIITSSYPAYPGDPEGTAGLFVRSFAKALAKQGHRVIVQPIARKKEYQAESDIIIEPIPWLGGNQELASMNIFLPSNWLLFFKMFSNGKKNTIHIHKKYDIDKTMCMWVIPCGLFGYWIKKNLHKPYDVWALGSDIWKIKKIPLVGKWMIKKVVQGAHYAFADGFDLAKETEKISQKTCHFLASTRTLPQAQQNIKDSSSESKIQLLFVGRYHSNKGPDLLIEAIALLNEETRKKIHLKMYGLGPLEEELKILIEKHSLNKTISFNGPVDDQTFANLLSQTDYFIIPSRIESIPLVFSDAIQCSIPVISMPVGDLQHLIEKYNCGIVAQETTAKDLSNAISTAVTEESGKSTFEQGLQMAQKDFNIENSASEWVKKTN